MIHGFSFRKSSLLVFMEVMVKDKLQRKKAVEALLLLFR
jgi:hypothetical protein